MLHIPFQLFVMFSGGASALRYLVKHDPNYRKLYKVVGAFTNDSGAAAIPFIREQRIPLSLSDYRAWCAGSGVSPRDLTARVGYFSYVRHMVDIVGADGILLSGFMLIITEPLLSAYQRRIINVHPSALDAAGTHLKYRGAHAVHDAFANGDQQTASTVHFITAEVDGGPIIVMSPYLTVPPGATPEQHQEAMKWVCDGPAVAMALERIAHGKVRLGA